MHPMTKRLTLIAGAVLVLSLTTAGSLLVLSRRHGATPTSTPLPHGAHRLVGSISAPECGGGYAIDAATVIVRDDHGAIIGTATTRDAAMNGDRCLANFGMDLPKARFYQIRIGSHDGPVWSYDDLQGHDWAVFLRL